LAEGGNKRFQQGGGTPAEAKGRTNCGAAMGGESTRTRGGRKRRMKKIDSP